MIRSSALALDNIPRYLRPVALNCADRHWEVARGFSGSSYSWFWDSATSRRVVFGFFVVLVLGLGKRRYVVSIFFVRLALGLGQHRGVTINGFGVTFPLRR